QCPGEIAVQSALEVNARAPGRSSNAHVLILPSNAAFVKAWGIFITAKLVDVLKLLCYIEL
ncbi:MAG TPA: hypothetical protein VLC52_12430, partial [Anaerolineae bacterium]|nr:hypothetical protein [Anaerolineae bacterium]